MLMVALEWRSDGNDEKWYFIIYEHHHNDSLLKDSPTMCDFSRGYTLLHLASINLRIFGIGTINYGTAYHYLCLLSSSHARTHSSLNRQAAPIVNTSNLLFFFFLLHFFCWRTCKLLVAMSELIYNFSLAFFQVPFVYVLHLFPGDHVDHSFVNFCLHWTTWKLYDNIAGI